MGKALHLAAILSLASPCRAANVLPPALLELAREAGVQEAPRVPIPEGRRAETVSLDAHRHFSDVLHVFYPLKFPQGKRFDFIEADMRAGNIERTILISDAYLRGKDDAERLELNAELSRFVAAHPERFHGLCGVNIAWDDRDGVLKSCLDLPGMIGVKLHFEWFRQTLTDPDQLARFTSLLETAKPYRAVFLLHMNFNADEAAEVDRFFALTRDYPELTFIIAHAAEEHYSALKSLGRRLDAAGGENVLAEISTSEIRDPAMVASALRAFGIGRVLFGVDGPSYSGKRSLERFKLLALSEDEQDAVLRRNGLSLLSKLSGR